MHVPLWNLFCGTGCTDLSLHLWNRMHKAKVWNRTHGAGLSGHSALIAANTTSVNRISRINIKGVMVIFLI